LYLRLGFQDQAEQVLKEGLRNAKEGDKHLFAIHTLLGSIYDTKNNTSGALAEYEAAKKSCGNCTEPGQPIAFFNLGAAYASANPPRKSEAMQQLAAFNKVICKGGAAARYADQCQQSQELAKRMGGALQ
jgi:hypothetical protein